MTDEAELSDMQHRLDDLEDRFHVEYPMPDTSVGALQRLRLEVPTPSSVLTIGARGTAASEGQAIGPGGFGLTTEEHLGAQIRGSTCIDTDGLTIVHSLRATRILTGEDLGIASNASMRLGTTEGDVELTAGEVPVNDPAFTVVPSMVMPGAPVVDTRTPRNAMENARERASLVWHALEASTGIRTWNDFRASLSLSSGAAAGTWLARVATVINLARTAYAIKEAAIAAGAAAVAAFDTFDVDDLAPSAPELKLHGAGGVALTSPSSVSAFAPKVSLVGQQTASLKGTQKVSVKSLGYASLYGGGIVSIASEGPAGLKSTNSAATLSGKYADVAAKETAVLRSGKTVGVVAKERISMDAPSIAMGGNDVGVSGTNAVEIEAPNVKTSARTQNTVHSSERVLVQAGQTLRMEVGASRIEVVDGEISLYPGGGGASFVVDRGVVSAYGFRVERDRTRIRGNVDLG